MFKESVDPINYQEEKYVIYSWPSAKSDGTRCYVIDNAGEVLSAPNQGSDGKKIYLDDKSPPFNAAFDSKATTLDRWMLKDKTNAQDGQTWTSIN